MRERKIDITAHQVTNYSDVDAMGGTGRVPSGIVVVREGGLPIDVMHRDREADTTLVCLHGAVEREVTLPWFVGQGVTEGLPLNRISISDPTLQLSSAITLSWYSGSREQPDLQRQLVRLIGRILERSSARHVAFFGGSGGGFAALMLARHFPGSLAIAMNPQTSIGRYFPKAIDTYLSEAWGADSLESLPAHVSHDLVSAYAHSLPNHIAYIQNTRDDFHINAHQLPLLEAIGASSRVSMLMDRWGPAGSNGHVPPPKELVRAILQAVATANGDWSAALDRAGFQSATLPSDVRAAVVKAAA